MLLAAEALDHLERQADRIATAFRVHRTFAGRKSALNALARACNTAYLDFGTWKAEAEEALVGKPQKLDRARRHAQDMRARWIGLYIRVATLIGMEPDLTIKDAAELRATLRTMLFRVWQDKEIGVVAE